MFSEQDVANALDPGSSEGEIVEFEPTDASTLAVMNWSFDNFPEGKGPEGEGGRDAASSSDDATLDTLLSDDDGTVVEAGILVEEVDDIAAIEAFESTQRALPRLDDTLQPTQVILETEAWAADLAEPSGEDDTVIQAAANDEATNVESVVLTSDETIEPEIETPQVSPPAASACGPAAGRRRACRGRACRGSHRR